MRRRTFLVLTASSFASLSGCLGLGDDDATDVADDAVDDADDIPADDHDGTTDDAVDDPDGADEADDEPSEESPADVVEAGERFVGDMAEGAFESAVERFRADLHPHVSAGELEALWMGFTAVSGAFERTGETEETVQAGFDAVDLGLAFERREHTLRVLVDDGEFDLVGATVNDEYRPPAYVDDDAFAAEDVTLETEDCLMDATVTLPADGGDDVPGVVLVHGSDPVGAADRDLSTVGAKPFRDLAEGLASRGVAVLRYDRRSHACPPGPAEWTLDRVVVDDALVALDRLREVPAVDPGRVVVAGLSLGGMAAPRIADRDGELVGIIMLAPPAREFHETFLDQFEYLATVGEYEWEQMAEIHAEWETRIDRIRGGDYGPGDVVLDYPGALWESVDEYDHLGVARDVEVPMLVLQGGRDYQVTVEDDFEVWQAELEGRPGTTFELYEELNHLFQRGDGPSVPAEYSLAVPVDGAVVEDVATWVGNRR